MILSTTPDGSSNLVDSGIDLFWQVRFFLIPILVYFFFLHFSSAVNKNISSLSHKRDSSLYFFFLARYPLYIGKHLQTTNVLPYHHGDTDKVFAAFRLFGNFLLYSFFPSCFSSVFCYGM